MSNSSPRFLAVYNIINGSKRNGSSRTVYKDAPKSVKTMYEAHLWYNDKVASRGRAAKRLVEIRESSV